MNTAQFAAFLAKGSGRPFLYLQNHDPAPYTATLLEACLSNPTYDRQCEGERTDYFFGLMQRMQVVEAFRQPLLDALATVLTNPDDSIDYDQLAEFAAIYARTGDPQARSALYAYATREAALGNRHCAYELIDLDGVAGFLFFANQFGKAMQADTTLWDGDELLQHLEHVGAESDPERLRAAAEPEYPYVSFYLDKVAAWQTRPQHRTQPRQFSYAELQQVIQRKRSPGMVPRRWARTAKEEEFHQAALDLLQQDDPVLISSYLRMFGERAFPFGFEPLLPLVWHSDALVARWSITAISLFHDPRVRELGFALIEAGHYISDALELFVRNYQPGDEQFFATLLARTEDIHTLHHIGYELNYVFAANPTLAAEPLLIELYERTPCSLCRERFVQRLIAIDRVPPWLEDEARHDANPDIFPQIAAHQQAHAG